MVVDCMCPDVRTAPVSARGRNLSLPLASPKLARFSMLCRCTGDSSLPGPMHLVLGLLCAVTCLSPRMACLSCVQEVAASYSFGAVGSLIYLRLLNRSVDSVGGFSVGAALGQPRLLIPIILTAAYNR